MPHRAWQTMFQRKPQRGRAAGRGQHAQGLEVPQTRGVGGELGGLEPSRPALELGVPIWESELAALILGTPKSWAPNSGCEGPGFEGQQEVIQRPAHPFPPPTPCPGLGTGAKSWKDSGPQEIGLPEEARPPKSSANPQASPLLICIPHFHWLQTSRLGPGFPRRGGGAWGARVSGGRWGPLGSEGPGLVLGETGSAGRLCGA